MPNLLNMYLYQNLLQPLEYAQMDSNFTQIANLLNGVFQASGVATFNNGGVGIYCTPNFALDVNSNYMAIGGKTAVPGWGGQILFRHDGAAVGWQLGISGSPGGRDFFLYSIARGVGVVAVDPNGNMSVNGSGSSNHSVRQISATTDGSLIMDFTNNANSGAAIYGSADVAGYGNAANSIIRCGKAAGTSRSINAAGTVNTSGADYAEYEYKASACGVIEKGQIVGFNSDGRITDKWAEAVSYGIKSTSPSYVGGDIWGNEEVVGKIPTKPERRQEVVETRDTGLKDAGNQSIMQTVIIISGDTDAEWNAKEATYATDLAAFEARLEVERQKVDRIAYSGKVPVNVLAAAVGDYIIAAQDGYGIKGIAVADPDFGQYRKAVGRVRRILSDGRAEVAVIVH